jgi:hypothetical protein
LLFFKRKEILSCSGIEEAMCLKWRLQRLSGDEFERKRDAEVRALYGAPRVLFPLGTQVSDWLQNGGRYPALEYVETQRPRAFL